MQSELTASAPYVPAVGKLKIYTKIMLRLIPFLGLCLMTSSLDRVNVSFAKLQMLDELQFSNAVYGIGAGIFFLGYIPFEVPSNAILARVGAKLWIGRIMITWGIMSGLMMFVQTPAQFYVLRFLLGMAEAGGLPGVLYYLTSWFPSWRRGRVIGLLMLGGPIATMFGGPISGIIMQDMHGLNGWSGWQWLFLLEAMPSVILGLIAFFYLPKSPTAAKWLSPEEKTFLADELAHDVRQAPPGLHRFRDGLLNKRVWLLGGIDFSILLATYAMGFWLPTFIRGAGETDLVRIGFLCAIPSMAGIAGLLLLSASSDKYRERRWHIIVPFLVAAVALSTSTLFLDNVAMIVICFAVAMMMVTGTISVFFTLPATFLTGPAAAAGFALACSLANIAGLVSNSITGFALELTGSPASALLIFSGSLCVSCLIVYSLPPKLVNR
ncbi:MFS transporter [Sphingomonas naphthae]|uniref:MFS transporter n=1 Tax=Sphingomonas naphthae TaxID=1813468 RepID=A0ABY7TMZ4_9SPHN|nr:MFS transporter [Sphingomonas naphthae]WCT74613.1 MFS transporter [Sphingomonas naphthae]